MKNFDDGSDTEIDVLIQIKYGSDGEIVLNIRALLFQIDNKVYLRFNEVSSTNSQKNSPEINNGIEAVYDYKSRSIQICNSI